jgi:hypothetical protein
MAMTSQRLHGGTGDLLALQSFAHSDTPDLAAVRGLLEELARSANPLALPCCT